MFYIAKNSHLICLHQKILTNVKNFESQALNEISPLIVYVVRIWKVVLTVMRLNFGGHTVWVSVGRGRPLRQYAPLKFGPKTLEKLA